MLYIAIAGFLYAYLHAQYRLWPSLDHNLQGQDIEITGWVKEIYNQSENYTRFIFKTEKINTKKKTSGLPKNIMLSWYDPESRVAEGQTCQFTVRLKHYWRYANPGSVDIEKAMFLQNIGARGYIKKAVCLDPGLVETQTIFLRDLLIHQFAQKKNEYDYFAWMMALSFGVRDYLTEHDWEVLRKSGSAHLVAISGLHLSVIGLFAFFIFRRLACCSTYICEYVGAQRIAAAFAMFAVFFYAYIAGFSLPTQRALIMVCIAFTAVIFNKPLVSFPLLATTLLFTLLWDPMSVLSASFWMTFLAVLFIFVIIKSAPTANKWYLALRIQLSLSIALFPVSLWFFQEGSLVAPLVNLIAVPYISFLVLPFLLIAQALFVFDLSIASYLFHCLDILLGYFWWFIQSATTFSFSSYQYQPSFIGVLLFEIAWVLFLVAKEYLLRFMSLLLCAALFLFKHDSLQEDQLRLAILDVGQGLSVHVQTKHHSLLYDLGPQFPSGFNTVDAVVLPYLRFRHISHIDKLVISHHDNDHAGGLETMLASGLVDTLYFGHAAKITPSKAAHHCVQGEQWLWGKIRFEILHPPEGWRANSNNSSCVIQIFHPAATILLTGDIEAEVEYRLLTEFGDRLRSDIMVVPHHGSLSSSTPAFIEVVAPQIAIYSTGFRNRYGFPHDTIRSRYQFLGAKQRNTANEGAIIFELDVATGVQEMPSYRSKTQRYWHSRIEN
jgi:competence protein ComEC